MQEYNVEFNEEFWSNLHLLRPMLKARVSLPSDGDVVDWFRGQGKGYQSYMNAVLRSFVESTRK